MLANLWEKKYNSSGTNTNFNKILQQIIHVIDSKFQGTGVNIIFSDLKKERRKKLLRNNYDFKNELTHIS